MFLLRLTLKNIANRKFLFLGTALSVVLGVAFVVGVFIVTDSLRATFDDIADDIAGSIDLRVRSELEFGDRLNAPEVDPALADEIAAVDGVAAVTGGVAAWNVVIIDRNGEPLQSLGPPQFGVSWSDEENLTELYLAEGRPPAGPNEFATNSRTVEFADLRIGETYRVSLPDGTRAFELVGTVNWADPDEDQSQGVQFSVFDLATATELLNGGGGWDEILVDVDREADVAAVAGTLKQTLPPGLEVLTVEEVAEEQSAEFGTFITIFQNILLAFAVITLVVSAFLVNNVFSIVIGQRIRELGLLRVVGATGVQIRRSVLGEAAAVGVIATALGLAGGIGVSAALKAIFGARGGELPIDPLLVTGRTVGVAIAVGVGITMLAALSPALKARRITPVEALREDARLSTPVVARRPVVGGLTLIAGLVLLALGLAAPDWPALIPLALVAAVLANWGGKRIVWWAGRLAVAAVGLALLLTAVFADLGTTHLLVALSIGVLTVFVGINMTSPLFARPMARALGAPLARLDGMPGHLARQNAARSPRRTSSTAAALMIGLALVVTVSVVADSLKSSLAKVLDEQVNADWLVCIDDCNDQFSGFSPGLGADLEALPEVASVASFRFLNQAFRTPSDEAVHGLMSIDTADLEAHIDVDPVAGAVSDLPPDGLLVQIDQAETYELAVGDRLDVEVLGGEQATWVIAGIFEDDTITGPWVVSADTWGRYFDTNVVQFASVVTAGGVSADAARAAIATAADNPQLTVRSRAEFRDAQSDQIDQALIIVNVFLGLSLVIAVLGIVATLALSVVERTRELGLLRAVGMTRGQMRRMVCWEGLVVATFGGILGVVLGVAFGVLAADIIPDSVVSTLSIPGGQIVLYLVIAALAGLASGILPAIWAGRLKVLEAIGYE